VYYEPDLINFLKLQTIKSTFSPFFFWAGKILILNYCRHLTLLSWFLCRE
jgi:hypothetical protein